MDPNGFTDLATQAAERYQGVLSTFRSILLANQGQPFSPARLAQIRSNAVGVGNLYLTSEREHIRTALENIAQEAVGRAQSDAGGQGEGGVPQEFRGYLDASAGYLESEIRAQLSRDVEALVKRYREFALEADMVSRSTGMPLSKAIAHVGQTMERQRFQFRDRVGRLYPAQKFIRTVWRHTAIVLDAEFYMLEATSYGATHFVVEHPDPAYQWQGRVIDPAASDFLAVRDEVFHPNSNATLRAADVQPE